MTNRQLINEILRNHPEVTVQGINPIEPWHFTIIAIGTDIDTIEVDFHYYGMKIYKTRRLFWEIPWEAMCNPSWTAESFVKELIERARACKITN